MTTRLRKLLTAVLGIATMMTSLLASTRELKAGEWYVRLTVASVTEGYKDHSNSIGQLRDASFGPDKYDSRELPPFLGPYLSIVFYHPDWDVTDYTSDYRPKAKGNKPIKNETWPFEVRSDNPARDLIISWKGNQADWTRMVLIDLEGGNILAAIQDGELQQYHFNMGGETVRAFEWRLLADEKKVTQLIDKFTRKSDTTKSDWSPFGGDQHPGQRKGVADELPADPFDE
jgi:hypothetical protein